MSMTSTHTPWPRVGGLVVVLTTIVSAIVLAFLWPAVTASVKSLPIAVVGETAQVNAVEAALDERAPGTFEITSVADRAAAVDLIERRDVYGAIVLGASPEVLTATAASPIAAQALAGLAPALQAQITAALTAQGIPLASPVVVEVTDVVPLLEADPRGAVLAASSFPVVLGGMLGGIAISIAVVGIWRRVAAVITYSAVGGLAITGILQGWFGALQGDYLVNAAAIALALLSIGGVIVGAAALLGRPGIAVGPILFLLVANPISAATQPVEFLAEPWGAVGQWFPPGAAATLLRDLSYFPAADTTFVRLVLVGWVAAGILLATLGHFRQAGAASRAARVEATA